MERENEWLIHVQILEYNMGHQANIRMTEKESIHWSQMIFLFVFYFLCICQMNSSVIPPIDCLFLDIAFEIDLCKPRTIRRLQNTRLEMMNRVE